MDTVLVIVTTSVLVLYLGYFLRRIYFTTILKQVPFVSSKIKPLALPILQIIDSYVPRPGQVIWYELGAGTAKISRILATQLGFKQVIAIEYDWSFVIVGKVLSFIRNKRLQINQGDIFRQDFQPGSVLYCYLYPSYLKKLFEQNKLDGMLVISLCFEIPGLEPTTKVDIESYQKTLFVYDLRK